MTIENFLIPHTNLASMLMVFTSVLIMSGAHFLGGILLPYGYAQDETTNLGMATRFFTYLGVQMIGLTFLFGFIKGTALAIILSIVYTTTKYVIWRRILGVFQDSGWTQIFRSGLHSYLISLTTALEFFIMFGLMWILACAGAM